MNDKYSVVITTCANDEDAKVIIDSLLEKKLGCMYTGVSCKQLLHMEGFSCQ